LLDTFDYPGQGWGLTLHGQQFIMSNGSSFLRFLDSASMRETGRVQVKKHGQPVKNLNELEMVRGSLYANVWHSDLILIISPYTGVVTGQVNLQGLLKRYAPHARANVLNGIAYDDKNDRLFVTGKRWPLLFEIRLKEKH
jgi:glutamine cyclotransferase